MNSLHQQLRWRNACAHENLVGDLASNWPSALATGTRLTHATYTHLARAARLVPPAAHHCDCVGFGVGDASGYLDVFASNSLQRLRVLS